MLGDADKIDAIGFDARAGEVILTIADERDWADVRGHLLALQAKLNAYLGFVESGEVFEAYPHAAGRRLVIDVVGRFPVPTDAWEVATFFERAAECAAELGVRLRVGHWPGSSPAGERPADG